MIDTWDTYQDTYIYIYIIIVIGVVLLLLLITRFLNKWLVRKIGSQYPNGEHTTIKLISHILKPYGLP